MMVSNDYDQNDLLKLKNNWNYPEKEKFKFLFSAARPHVAWCSINVHCFIDRI
jgi:hypothetical protein